MATDTAEPQVVAGPTKDRPSGRRSMVAWVALLALVATAVVASNLFSLRDRLFGSAVAKPELPATSKVATGYPGTAPGTPVIGAVTTLEPTSLRSQPWWQTVATLDGTGDSSTSVFTIGDSAIQWRVSWSCDTGQLVVRAPKRTKALVDGGCPQGDPGYATETGTMSLQVSAGGPWHLEVDQEIDAPLVEAPTAAMSAPGSKVVASGSFSGIDQTGMGQVTIYRQADGLYSLRLVDFFVSPTTDLELRMSTLAAPHNSQDLMTAPSVLVGPMDVTAGSLNYTVPSTVDVTRFHSLYVWCSLTQSAYAGASLVASP